MKLSAYSSINNYSNMKLSVNRYIVTKYFSFLAVDETTVLGMKPIQLSVCFGSPAELIRFHCPL